MFAYVSIYIYIFYLQLSTSLKNINVDNNDKQSVTSNQKSNGVHRCVMGNVMLHHPSRVVSGSGGLFASQVGA